MKAMALTSKLRNAEKKNFILNEISSLRSDINKVKQFLKGCEDSIESETKKLEKLCLEKIHHLEMGKGESERKLCLAQSENVLLTEKAKELGEKLLKLEKDMENFKAANSNLQFENGNLQSKLKTQKENASHLEKEIEEKRLKCFELENKLESNKVYMHEEKNVLCEMLAEQEDLKSQVSELRLHLVEKEAYENALQEHVFELEEICTVLRDQVDEQQKYFVQKEITLRKEADQVQQSVAKENKLLSNELRETKIKLDDAATDLGQKSLAMERMRLECSSRDDKILNLEDSLQEAKEDLRVETSTVEMLTKKNHDLSLEITWVQSEMRRLQDRCSMSPSSDASQMDKKALKEIENTIQHYFDDQRKWKDKVSNSVLSENLEKLTEYQEMLKEERKKRLSAEIKVENLLVELEKAKVESAMQRTHLSARKTRRSKTFLIHRLGEAIPPRVNLDNAEEVCGGLRAMGDLNLSSIPQPDDSIQVPLSGSSSISSNDSSSLPPDFYISQRATQKVEEAKQRALAMLSGIHMPNGINHKN